MQLMNISYKTVPIGSGCCAYVFGIWAGGIYACYRRVMYAKGTNTMIYKHKMYVEKSTGRRYIAFRAKNADNKKIKAYYDDIKCAAWEYTSVIQAHVETGINVEALRRVKHAIDKIAENNRLNITPRPAIITKHIRPSSKKRRKAKLK